ncbi:protoporphyrinogen oxidase [Humitalea rosea]|uniref:Protoporphyrinogen oxidase n=1 Tax=Humitalea rosea TaxID=990373 RepID=A0A2W7IQD6_9PROT|nr:FAD-dependent oxidoreductase [Humitalea rosea]PZW48387.1 protoporphyrinogen oxidase [Humitalea rosea]
MTVHVVGAGVAGLAAALALAGQRGADAGRAVRLWEAAPVAGGRCRALPDGRDNGTHALLAGNRAALGFLGAIGAREAWVEPEPDGLPLLDLADGSLRRIALSPSGWWRADRRPAGGIFALARLFGRGPDRSLAETFADRPELLRGFVEPLAIAALNTPVAEASTALLGSVARRLAWPGAARLLVAREGLGPGLIAPALAALAQRRVPVVFGARLRGVETEAGRATRLLFAGEQIALGRDDAVLFALPPWEATRLLPGLAAPGEHAPILNLHFGHGVPGPVRFVGVLGGLCQWVLFRPEGIAVTVSAADAESEEPGESLGPRAWAEILRAVAAVGIAGEWPIRPPACRVVKERRATPRHRPGPRSLPPRLPLANLALAGDWTDPDLPATIEAAVRSGQAAARALPLVSRL